MIYKHYCIEKIYLYGSINDESSLNLSAISTEISSQWLDLEQLCIQVNNDIKMMIERPLHWDRSAEFFGQLHTQQFESKQSSAMTISANILSNKYIIIFHCNNEILFKGITKSTPLREFTDADKCSQFITERSNEQIYLIISGNKIPSLLKSIINSQNIYAIYLFRTNEIIYPIKKIKVSGSFNNIDGLAKQLENDILFDKDEFVHTSRIDIFKNIEQEKKIIPQLNKEQVDFLILQLFIDILPQIPPTRDALKYITKECNKLSDKTKIIEKIVFEINKLLNEYEPNNLFKQNLQISQIVLRFHQLNMTNILFILQNKLVDIQKSVLESSKTSLSNIVYISKIVSYETLEMMQSSCDQFITIGIFVLATKSFITARNIARQSVNNGFISILFEIDVVKDTHLLNVDDNRVIFPLDPVFRLKSIYQMPDDVWYVKIQCADKKFQSIKEQLQFQIGIPFTWLTYGNYLHFLNRFEQGEYYFRYLLDNVSYQHIIALTSIYNNIGLLYFMIKEDDRANNYYRGALDHAKLISTISTADKHEDQFYKTISTSNITLSKHIVDYDMALSSIAEIYYKKQDYSKALNFYKKAFESSTDQRSRRYYQQIILTLSNNTTENPTDIFVEVNIRYFIQI